MARLHENYPRLSKLPKYILEDLHETDGNVIDHITKLYPDFTTKTKVDLVHARAFLNRRKNMVTTLEDAENTIQFIRKTIQSRQQKRAQEMEEEQAEWLRAGSHPNKVFKTLSIAQGTYGRALINPLASPDLEVLRQYIERYNKLFIDAQRKEITLVGTLYEGFGRDLARYLFAASHSPIFGPDAMKMHQTLLEEWYRDGMTIDAAADKLGIATTTVKGTWIKYLYTFIEYSALLHTKGRVKEGTTFSYLKTRIGDYFFSLLIADARNLGNTYLVDWEKELFKIWKKEGVTPNDLYRKVILRTKYYKSDPDRMLEEVIRNRFATWWNKNEFN
ncbi:unnamed protein product [Hyaloperonospora brassicae]|uniref:RxLR effector candidate protein n=1 Tax=Hyaloperonospora brassicae TaxID=162125 RepID=A0AAV0UC60_HYABA|nr:unnamed protein product [Hyaloperonospora brassicae]